MACSFLYLAPVQVSFQSTVTFGLFLGGLAAVTTEKKHSHLFIPVRLRETSSYGTCTILISALCTENIRRKQSAIEAVTRKAVWRML